MKRLELNILLLFFFLPPIVCQSQENTKYPRIEDMHQRKFEFLSQQAHLTPQEINCVRPIFMSYEKTLWTLGEANRNCFKDAIKGRKTTKPIFSELNDNYINFESQKAELLKNYHKQLKKILQPETLFNFYRAERQFKRELLKNFPSRPLFDDNKPPRPE